MLRERAVQEPAAEPGSWQAGTRARTGLSACLGGWSLPKQHASSSEPMQQHNSSQKAPEEPAKVTEDERLCLVKGKGPTDPEAAADACLKRQQAPDKLQQGDSDRANGDSFGAYTALQDQSSSCQQAAHAGVQHSRCGLTNGDLLFEACASGGAVEEPAGGSEAAGQAGAGSSGHHLRTSERQDVKAQEAAEQAPLSHADEQMAASSNGGQNAPQDCEICCNPMQHVYVSAPALLTPHAYSWIASTCQRPHVHLKHIEGLHLWAQSRM